MLKTLTLILMAAMATPAAALASLKLFKRERTLARLQPKIRLLKRLLEPLKAHAHVTEVRQLGMMAGIELVKDKRRGTPYAWEEKIGVRVCRMARDHGVILRPLGPVIVLMPPLCVTEAEIKKLVRTVELCINRVVPPL